MTSPTPKQMVCKKPAARMQSSLALRARFASAKSAPKRQPKAKAKASTSPSASNGSSDYRSSPSVMTLRRDVLSDATSSHRRLKAISKSAAKRQPKAKAKASTSPSGSNGSSDSRSLPYGSVRVVDVIKRAWTIGRLLHEWPAVCFMISVWAKDCYPRYKGRRSDYMYDVLGNTEYRVRELKLQLFEMENWPVNLQRLILYKESFNDRVELNDDMTLGHYGIRETSVLSLHLTQSDAIWFHESSHRSGTLWSHPGPDLGHYSPAVWTHHCGRNPVPTELIPDPVREQLVTQSQLDNEPRP